MISSLGVGALFVLASHVGVPISDPTTEEIHEQPGCPAASPDDKPQLPTDDATEPPNYSSEQVQVFVLLDVDELMELSIRSMFWMHPHTCCYRCRIPPPLGYPRPPRRDKDALHNTWVSREPEGQTQDTKQPAKYQSR